MSVPPLIKSSFLHLAPLSTCHAQTRQHNTKQTTPWKADALQQTTKVVSIPDEKMNHPTPPYTHTNSTFLPRGTKRGTKPLKFSKIVPPHTLTLLPRKNPNPKSRSGVRTVTENVRLINLVAWHHLSFREDGGVLHIRQLVGLHGVEIVGPSCRLSQRHRDSSQAALLAWLQSRSRSRCALPMHSCCMFRGAGHPCLREG